MRGSHARTGIALVLTLIVMGVLTIGTVAVDHRGQLERAPFGRDRQVNRALNVAEAGLNAGVAAVKALPATATSLPGASGTIDQGSWSYTATRTQDATNPNLYYWTVTSTGVSPDGNVTRIVSTKVSETITSQHRDQTVTTPPSPAYSWGMFLGDAASDCTTSAGGNTLGGSSGDHGRRLRQGLVCVSGNSSAVHPPADRHPGTSTSTSVASSRASSNGSPIGTSVREAQVGDDRRGLLDGNHTTATKSESP